MVPLQTNRGAPCGLGQRLKVTVANPKMDTCQQEEPPEQRVTAMSARACGGSHASAAGSLPRIIFDGGTHVQARPWHLALALDTRAHSLESDKLALLLQVGLGSNVPSCGR